MKIGFKFFIALACALATASVASAAPLAAPWDGVPVGDVKHPGGVETEGELIRVNGAGYNIGGQKDSFYFVSQVVKGEAAMSAHFAKGLQYVDPRGTSGVMLRASDADDAPFVYMGLVSQSGATFRVRAQAGADVQITDKPGKYTTAQEGNGAYLKVERRGRTVIGSLSDDGKTWQEIGRALVDWPDELLAGLAMTSSDPNQKFGFSWFDQMQLNGATGIARVKKPNASLLDVAEMPGREVIGIDFTQKPPVERGLSFDRTAVSAGTHSADGKNTSAWVARWTIEQQMQWTRSFRFKITDARFKNGARPAVDIEIVYAQSANAPVMMRADTARGGVQIASAWGNSPDWQTMRVRLDDAFFGARDYPAIKDLSTSGFDLRFDGMNSDLWLKSVKITGYDPKENIYWPRLLRIDDARGQTPGGLLVFGRNAKNTIDVDVNNIAAVPRPLRYTLRVAGYDDKVRFSKDGEVKIAASGVEKLPFNIDTSDWPFGPYDGKLSFYLDDKNAEPILERTFGLGVISDAKLAKARPGEFLYGLDAGHADAGKTGPETALRYLELMGVDITRDIPSGLGETGAALKTLGENGLSAGRIIDPPRESDSQKRAAKLKTLTAQLEDEARQFAGSGPGKYHFWELGNEPDLPFFYPGPMPEYIESMNAMYDAIKRGAGDKPTQVFNGGLSFAGPEGDARSREFIAKVDPTKIDLLAYHAHGPGIGAERNVYEKVKAEAAKAGKDKIVAIDTETGFAGTNRSGYIEQARTVVEKITYAQSKGLPALYFFRLFMEGSAEAGYSLTNNIVEPRPSIMAYRNLVERLRHQKFVAALPFAEKAGTPGVHAFLFAEQGDNGQATGRKTLVAFTEGTARYDLSLRLDEAKSKVSGAQIFDLYGNATSAKLLPGNAAQISVDANPIYLSWNSNGAAKLADVLPSVLKIESDGPMLTGTSGALKVTARNISDQPLPVEIVIEAKSRLPIEVAPPTRSLTIPANDAVSIPLSVKLGEADAPLNLPQWWKVFVDADATKMKADQWATIPETLPGKNGEVKGAYAAAPGNRLSLDALAGGFGERRNAVAYAVMDAPRAMNLPVAAYADWWMAWYVNGEKVYDGLNNGGGLLTNHLFELPLKAGRNIIAAQVQSGSQGWKLYFGGPAERQAAQSGTLTDAVKVVLKSGGNVLAQQEFPLQISAPIAPLGQIKTDSLSSWMALEPLAVLQEDTIENFFVKEPDQTRWYKGDKDLSALVWLRDDGANLQLFVAARDDKLVESKTSDALNKSDALQISLAGENGVFADLRAGLVGGAATLSGKMADIKASITRDEKAEGGAATLYHLTIPKTLVGAKPFRLHLMVFDNDGFGLKQTLKLDDVRLRAR